MIKVTLFHDGCNICLDINTLLSQIFSTPAHHYQAFNLSEQKECVADALAAGVTRLPSLLIDGRVLRLDDHSPIEHYVK
ncbi:hypothetical protein MJ863_16185 [Alcaligenes ammonioxydans]|jgi:hypothetical protein|uniref:Thioredoxin family protein n=1 Tax=Alcaligenes ammonioxydans TaxID=2582914 RepID=A0ABX8T1G7_9BURK|nr:hypothetical protein [Alcaligenes ammonioxydans]EJC62705.1 hypothetical protein QWA_08421 [Alcaligenes faecalis subsp. faecalis NCIB 8687]QBH18835.1 hypothetical protein EYC51_04660 [Alcaligenes faecalis]MCH1881124.1 hypothetical protein [Alcaligenes ammonioxydans]QXX79944.1 hypothetical protein FE795_13585 [Alcaligenes ammonioxydans]WGQ34902.1 hypothetical protein QEZ63_13620 [Alcaligenes faecalis]